MRIKTFNRLLVLLMLLTTASAGFAQRTLTGVVLDTDGNTLPGATVVVPGTTRGATTDIDGNFTIRLEPADAEIEVSFIGYMSRKVNIEGVDFIEVTLTSAIEQLDEVVLTALVIKRESKAKTVQISVSK